MKVIKEKLLMEAPRDGAVDFKLPDDMLNNPNSIDLKGMASKAKKDADAKAAEEARQRELEANKAKYSELIDRAQAAGEPEKMLEVLHKELVPGSGKADTVAGEIVRAMMRILYRDYNDGDLFYEGYGIETCGSSVAYLIYVVESTYDMFDKIANRQETDDRYTDSINGICNEVLNFIFTDNSAWLPNEDDSRGSELSRVYEEDYREEWEPEYDYDFMIPPTIQEYIEAGHIIVDEFIERVEDALNGNGFIKYNRVEDSWSNYINVTGLNRESYDELESWRMWEDSAWDDYIEELRDEYGNLDDDDDDYEDDDEEDDIDESFENESNDQFKKGDKVRYNGKVTTIVEVENDPKYGIDYLIVNPNYDGTDARYENIWVGDAVEPV